jgi:hypothetical protein
MSNDNCIKAILNEVDKTITGRDAMNIIAAMDSETQIPLFDDYGERIDYILKIEYSTFNKEFAVVLNVGKRNSCLLKNIVLGFAPTKYLANKMYRAWVDEISSHIITRFFCQNTGEFYEFPLNI